MNLIIIIAAASSLAAGLALGLLVNNLLTERELVRNKGELLARLSAPGTLSAPGSLSAPSSLSAPGTSPKPAPGSAEKPQILTKGWSKLLGKLPFGLVLPSFLRGGDKASQSARQLQYDSQLTMLIDITALGMRAGMAFDQSFELALQRSPGELAQICLAKLNIWQKGLITREQGLKELADIVQTTMFTRFSLLVLRALRYGAPMAHILAAMSDEIRRDIRSRREEEVARAPVKMLIPTGTLILPAMLLLVLGPIMLDLIGKL